MRREFAIVPPDLRLVVVASGIGLLVGVIAIGFAAREQPMVWLAAVVMTVVVVATTAGLVRRRHVVLDGDLLIIAGGVNTARVRTADLDIAAARILDLANDAALKPRLKTFGTAMPGYRAGHFRLRNRSRAFVLLTDTTKVLALPERSGRMLLLSLERPQALLDALKTMAEAGARR